MPNTARLQKSENLGPTATQSMNYITKTDFESILVQKLDSLKADLATKECIQGLKDVIEAQKIEINKLESRVVIMERYVAQLQRSADEQEQYQRRLCLRINGVEVEPGKEETGNDCLNKCKKIFKDLGVRIPETALDRAHRIGREKKLQGKVYRQIIVRFTTWRHRTMVYKARKASKGPKIRLDLTKQRLNAIGKMNDTLKSRDMQDSFAFADINCRFCVKINGEFHYLNDEIDFVNLMDKMDAGSFSEGEDEGEGAPGEEGDEEEEEIED